MNGWELEVIDGDMDDETLQAADCEGCGGMHSFCYVVFNSDTGQRLRVGPQCVEAATGGWVPRPGEIKAAQHVLERDLDKKNTGSRSLKAIQEKAEFIVDVILAPDGVTYPEDVLELHRWGEAQISQHASEDSDSIHQRLIREKALALLVKTIQKRRFKAAQLRRDV